MTLNLPPVTREEFYAEVGRPPETAEERAAQDAVFRAMLDDTRYERFWPLLREILKGTPGTLTPRASA